MNEWFDLKKDIPPMNAIILFYISGKTKDDSYWIGKRNKAGWMYINIVDPTLNNIFNNFKWNPIKRLKDKKNRNNSFYWRFINKDFNLSNFASSVVETEDRFGMLDIR